MKLTMTNKDHIARLIAEQAFKLPAKTDNDNILYNKMLRISEALETVGEIGSHFRKLSDLRHTKMPPVVINEKGHTIETDESYFDALCQIMQTVVAQKAA